MNREGQNGYFTLETKRRMKAEAQVSRSVRQIIVLTVSHIFSSNLLKALKEEVAGEESSSPKKTDGKKRGHVKNETDAEGAANDEPPAKKTKARTKKASKIKNENADGESEHEDSTTNRPKPRVKKEPRIKNEDADGGSEIEGPTTKKPKSRVKKEAIVKNEDADGGSENETSTTRKPKARVKKESKIKDEDTDGGSEQENPTTRKPPKQARAKKESIIKDEIADGGSELEGPTTKKPKSEVKKESKIKNENADGGSELEGLTTRKPKSRVKKEANIKDEEAATGSGNQVPADKKTKAAVKKGKKVNGNISDGNFEQDAQPVRRGRKPAKKATVGDESGLDMKDESSDHDALPPPQGKRKRPSRKAAPTKKLKDEDTETDGYDPVSEIETPLGNVKPEHTSELEAEASEEGPQLQNGRKKAPKKRAKRIRREG